MDDVGVAVHRPLRRADLRGDAGTAERFDRLAHLRDMAADDLERTWIRNDKNANHENAASYIATVSAAARSQLKEAARARPVARSFSTAPPPESASPIAFANSAGSGRTSNAPSPQTSGNAPHADATTAAPAAIPSSAGSPNPSYVDGTATTAAVRMRRATYCGGT